MAMRVSGFLGWLFDLASKDGYHMWVPIHRDVVAGWRGPETLAIWIDAVVDCVYAWLGPAENVRVGLVLVSYWRW